MEQAIYNNRKNYFFSESMKFEFCGFSKTLPMHSFGPAYRKHYILHIVLDGGGSYYVKNNSYHLTAGDMFLIRPDESTFYQADKNNPWVYCWLAFSGSEAEAIVEQSAFAKERYTLHSSQINSYVDIIKSCLTLNHETIEEELALNELLYKFFRILLIDTTHSVPSLQEEFSPLVQQTIQYV
jgi:lipoprotein NlpI